MSYGVNAPWGLQAIRTNTDASWNGKTNTYLIASGYNQNIFKGDLVFLTAATTNGAAAGYIINAFDINNTGANPTAFQTSAILGVFDGCSYAVPTSVNPIDPASPGHSYWPAGTQTLGGIPAIANVITDPEVVYNVQVQSTGATQASVGKFAYAVYQTVNDAGLVVNGNTSTGQSYLSLSIASLSRTANTQNFYIDALSANPNNVSGQSYNNVEVLLANSFFRQMPALTAY